MLGHSLAQNQESPNAHDEGCGEVYDRIIQAAVIAAIEGRFEDITVRKVAKAINVSPGTVTYYFANQEQLIDACLTEFLREFNELRTDLTEIIQTSQEESEEIIGMVMRRAYAYAVKNRMAIQMLLKASIDRGGYDEAALVFGMKPAMRFAENIIQTIFPQKSPAEARFNTQALVFLVCRFACMDEGSMRIVTQDAEDPRAEIEARLVDAASKLLAI